MSESDIITYGRDAASRGVDLFALLATDATASEADIRKAFRRKALTAHPDKTGDAYDPALYEGLERARDVLLTPAAREAYDSGMRAVLQKKMQLEQMSSKRRQLVEDLERREEEAKRAKTGTDSPRQLDPEFAAMAARGKAKMAEMKRQREEAEVRERLAREKEAPPAATKTTPQYSETHQEAQPTPTSTSDDYDERIADLERRIKEKQQRKAEKEQRKAEKKGKKAETPLAPSSLGRETSNNPPPPSTAESKADHKTSAAVASEPSEAPPSSNPPKASDRFASTFARLRAAQAKKDEEKRRKAEEEAPAAASVPSS